MNDIVVQVLLNCILQSRFPRSGPVFVLCFWLCLLNGSRLSRHKTHRSLGAVQTKGFLVFIHLQMSLSSCSLFLFWRRRQLNSIQNWKRNFTVDWRCAQLINSDCIFFVHFRWVYFPFSMSFCQNFLTKKGKKPLAAAFSFQFIEFGKRERQKN